MKEVLIVNSITSEAGHTQSAMATKQNRKYNTFTNSANTSAGGLVDHMQRSCAIATKLEGNKLSSEAPAEEC